MDDFSFFNLLQQKKMDDFSFFNLLQQKNGWL